MQSLVGYGSDEDGETGRYGYQPSGGGAASTARRREDDTNYDDVNMDMSEESQGGESEPELPPAAPAAARRPAPQDSRHSNDSRDRDRSRSSDRRDKHRERERPQDRERARHERERRSPRRDERGARRGLLGDRPADSRVAPRAGAGAARAADARDAASPRFVERRDRDRDRERDRDRDGRAARRSEDRRSSGSSGRAGSAGRERERRGAAYPPPAAHSSAGEKERRGSSPQADYRPSSYKVNRKLDVMEKMGLQIKTPDGSMATARELRAAAQPAGAPPPYALQSHRILDQVQKRKLLWANKGAAEAEAAKWSGARFAQDEDGKQVSKFMRLMGIKDPAAVKTDTVDATQDPNKKQEELFQAMQAQYEVARATTHTMRGVGLGFQRGNF